MYRYLAIFFSVAASALAQGGAAVPTSAFEYLGLSRQQIASVNNANNDYDRYQAGKLTRMLEVQREIAVETARSPLDPMALGLRYVELEVVRRELADQVTKTRQTVVAVLTDAQKTKLKALEDAAKLQPVVSDAQCWNLLPPAVQNSFASVLLLPVGSTVGQSFAVPCRVTRTGDFSPMPVQP